MVGAGCGVAGLVGVGLGLGVCEAEAAAAGGAGGGVFPRNPNAIAVMPPAMSRTTTVATRRRPRRWFVCFEIISS
jgi:hypothetical protein